MTQNNDLPRPGLHELQDLPYYNFTSLFENGDLFNDNPYDNINLNCEYLDVYEFLNKFQKTNDWNSESYDSRNQNH